MVLECVDTTADSASSIEVKVQAQKLNQMYHIMQNWSAKQKRFSRVKFSLDNISFTADVLIRRW